MSKEKENVQNKEQQAASEAEVQEAVPDPEQNQPEEEKAAAPEEKIAELERQIADLEKANADLKDQVLRRAADFDNYRKRAIQEKQEAFDFANANLLKDLLESLDNFDRTVEAAAKASDPKSIAEGVTMISRNLISMLENKYSLVSYGAAGDAFDPDIHEAIGSSQEPVAEPVLKEVYLKGYKLRDRVIRHAKVMVSMPDGSVQADGQDSCEQKDEASAES